jgi:hypothetical protein
MWEGVRGKEVPVPVFLRYIGQEIGERALRWRTGWVQGRRSQSVERESERISKEALEWGV